VADGKLIPKWTHEWKLEQAETQLSMYKGDVVVEWKYTDALTKINDLEEKLDAMTEDRDCKSDRIHDLENKLATINRISE
jgi:hypothetical protein